MVVQDPVQDPQETFDQMTVGEVHPGFAKNFNRAFNHSLPEEEQLAGWMALQEWQQHTDWMWGDVDLVPLKSRYETLINFRQHQEARPQLEEAYAGGETVEIDDSMWWPAALGKADPGALPTNDVMVSQRMMGMTAQDRRANDEVAQLIVDAPRGTRYRFEMQGDRRTVTQILPDGTPGFRTDSDLWTGNPFLDQRPGRAGNFAPRGAGEAIGEQVQGVVGGIAGGLPVVGTKVHETEAAYRNWLHQMGIRPTFGVGQNFLDEQGQMLDELTSDDPEAGLVDAFTGGGRGFYVEPGLRDRVWSNHDVRVYDNIAYLHGDVVEEDGRVFVRREGLVDSEGQEVPNAELELYDFRPDRDTVVTTPGGNERSFSYGEIMEEASNALAGGMLGVDNIIGHFYHGVEDKVDTPFGRMLVPKFTGNRLLDKDMMRDPRFLRSLLHADEKYGDNWWTRLSQESIGLAEFFGTVKGGKKLLGVAGARARRLARPTGEVLRRRMPGLFENGLLQLAGRTGQTWGRAVNPNAAGPTVKSVFTFNPSMVGAMVWHETVKGALTQRGSFDEWVSHGISGGLSLWAFGAATSALGRGLGLAGRGLAATETKIGQKLNKFLTRYEESAVQARLNQTLDDKLRKLGTLKGMEDRVARTIQREYSKEFLGKLDLQAMKHVTHSLSVGALMGSYSDAHYLAMRAGEEGLNWWDPAFMDYWSQAWRNGDWTASAVAFAGVTAAEYGWNRGRGAKQFFTKLEEGELKNLTEYWMRELDNLALNPDEVAGVFEVLGDPNVTSSAHVSKWIQERLGSSEIARDVDSPDLQRATVETLGRLSQERGGSQLIEETLSLAKPELLDVWEEQARAVRMDGEIDVNVMQGIRGVLGQIEAERGRREAGGQVEEKPVRERKKRPVPPEIPEEEWGDHFETVDRKFMGGAQRDRFRMLDSSVAIIQAKVPDGEGFRYIVVDGRQQAQKEGDFELWVQKEYPFTPEGLHAAMGDALAAGQSPKRLASRALVKHLKRLKQKKGAKGPPEAREKPGPKKVIVATDDARELLEALEDGEALRGEQRAEGTRKVLEHILEKESKETEQPVKPVTTRPEDPFKRVREELEKGDPTPERPETMQAQMDAMVAGRKPSVLFTKGEKVPTIPKGFRAVDVPRGTLVVKEGDDFTVQQAQSDRTLGNALGYGRGSKVPTQRVVTARDKKGRVVADIVSPPAWRVQRAAEELAGPGGTVEHRTAADALAERQGRAVPLSLAPELPGSRMPTGDELKSARRQVGDALEGRRGFGGLSGDERASRYLRPRDVASIEALSDRTRQARENPPPPLVPRSAKRPSQPAPAATDIELDAGLMEAEGQAEGTPQARKARQQALAESLRAAREAAVQAANVEARAAQEAPGPRSSLWTGPLGTSTREAQFVIGAQFFQGKGEEMREPAVFAVVQSRTLLERLKAERKATERPESAAELDQLIAQETQRVESIVAGMLVATGATPPKAPGAVGFHPVIARLTGLPETEIEGVRQRMIEEGRFYDPLIEEYLESQRTSEGRRVISPQQLHRTTAEGHQPTFDILRIVALAPPADLRLRRGKLFQGGRGRESFFRQFERWLDAEETPRDESGKVIVDPTTGEVLRYPAPRTQLHEALTTRGVDEGTASKAGAAALDARLGELGAIRRGRKNLTDIGGQLVAKVAQTLLGNHRLSARTTVPKLPGEPTLEEVALGLIEGISGRPAMLKERGQRVRSLEAFGPEIQSRAQQRREEVAQADPSATVELYFEAAKDTRELLFELMDVRMTPPDGAGGDFLLPRGKGGETSFVGGLDTMRVTNLLQRLSQGDPAILELMRASKEPDGTPSYADPEAHFRVTVERAQRVQAAQQHLVVSMAKEKYGPESAEQVRAILDALEWTSRGEAVPDHLVAAVDRSTELLPNGALTQDGGLNPYMSEALARELYNWVNEQGRAIDFPMSAQEVVPFFAGVHPAMFGFGEYQGQWAPVRVEALSLGKLLGHDINRPGVADWIASGGGIWSNPDGSATTMGRWGTKVLAGMWSPFARQMRSRSQPKEVRAANRATVRAIRINSEATMNQFLEQAQVWRDAAAKIGMTTAEANTLGKILDSGRFRAIQTKADWAKLFGEHRSHLYDSLADMADTFNRLAQWGVEAGTLDKVAAQKLHDSYFPRMWREMTHSSRTDTKAAARVGRLNIATGSSRERPRSGMDVTEETHNLIYDSRYSFPLAVWQEATWNRVWQAMGEIAADGHVLLSREAYEAMPETGRAWWRKATEPFGGELVDKRPDYFSPEEQASENFEALKARRRRATVEQTRLHAFFDEAESRAASQKREITPKQREIFERFREGYVTKAAQLEIDMMLDAADPTLDVRGMSAAVQRATLVWRRLKTIQNPKHWALNFTSSVLTNFITDKVSLFDFMQSVTTGRGIYAEAGRDLMRWHDWVRAGRPELDALQGHTAGVLRADRIAKMIGGGTLIRSAFGRFGARDMFDTMFTPRVEDSFDPEGKRADAIRDVAVGGSESTKSKFMRAIEAVIGRRGRSQADFDEGFARATGVPDPRVHAEALADLNEVYYLHEMLFKYSAALNGIKHRGLSERDAAEWGAEGSGDYLDAPPQVRRATTNFSAGISDGTRRGLEMLGQHPELPLSTRFMRMGAWSPFWMYRWSMWPTIGRAMVDRPIRTAAIYALMSAIVQAVDEITGGDRREMIEAVSGRNDWLASKLTPEVLEHYSKRYGHLNVPSFGGGVMPPWLRQNWNDWIEAWSNIGTGQGFAQSPGPSGEVLDWSTLLFPLLGEASKGARNVANLGKDRPATDVGEVQDLGVGFLVGAVLAGSMNVWDIAAGREGQSRRETALKTFSRMAREAFSVGGPVPLLSGAGQRGLLALEGRTITDLARGTPGKEVPLAQRLESFAISMAVPTRQVLAQSVEREAITGPEQALRRLGIRPNIFSSMAPADRFEKKQAIVNRGVNSLIRRQYVNAYREFVDHSNVLPMEAILHRRTNMDEDVRGFAGQRELADVAQTEIGRSFKRLVADPELQGLAVTRFEEVMSERGPALQKLAIQASALRTMHPAVFERMVDGLLRGEDSSAGVLKFLWDATVSPERKAWGADHEGSWVRMWDYAGLSASNFTGTNLRRYRQVQAWVEQNRSATDNKAEMLFPEKFDAPMGLGLEGRTPRQSVAPPDIFKIIEVPR